MEKGRGFLIHLELTYPDLVPYFKGIHLTLDSWREGRDEEGWKRQDEDEWLNTVDMMCHGLSLIHI